MIKTVSPDFVAVEAGTTLYHSSLYFDDLLSAGRFDPAYSRFGGAMFLAEARTLHANCVVEMREDAKLLDVTELRFGWSIILRAAMSAEFAEEFAGEPVDGFVSSRHDSMTRLAKGKEHYCSEIVILRESLGKLGRVRAISTR